MGDWTVLRVWGEHDGEHKGKLSHTVAWPECLPVVEEHQAPPEETPTAPEFTIAVSWNKGDIASFVADGRPSAQMGWKWSICWTGRDGGRKMRSGYGFGTPDTAKRAAEEAAKKVARGHLEEVYTYTPEI